ncbi:hypothetical protein [Methanobrevibacter arboriphilus]|nr:hypothetical protein [Methanobrevibacter arboriphilus]
MSDPLPISSIAPPIPLELVLFKFMSAALIEDIETSIKTATINSKKTL